MGGQTHASSLLSVKPEKNEWQYLSKFAFLDTFTNKTHTQNKNKMLK